MNPRWPALGRAQATSALARTLVMPSVVLGLSDEPRPEVVDPTHSLCSFGGRYLLSPKAANQTSHDPSTKSVRVWSIPMPARCDFSAGHKTERATAGFASGFGRSL